MPIPVAGAILGSAAIGAAGSIFSGKQSADAAKENYKKRYQWQVQDLKKAGLNPMLAVQNSPGSVPQPSFPNVGEAAVEGGSKAASALAAYKINKAQIDNLTAQTNKTIEEARGTEMGNLILQASPEYQSSKNTLGARGEVTGPSAVANTRIQAELKQVTAAADKAASDAQIASINAEIAKGDLTLKQIEVRYADELKKIETAYREAMRKAAEAGVPAAQAEAAFWSQSGEWGKAAMFIRQLIGSSFPR